MDNQNLLRILRFLKNRIRLFLFIGIGFLLGGALFIVYQIYDESRNLKEQERFTKMLQEPAFAVAGTDRGTKEGLDLAIEKLREYEAETSGRPAKLRSKVYLLGFLEKQGNWQGGQEMAEILAGEVRLPELKAFFYFRAGVLAENNGDHEAAETFFEQAESFIPEDSPLLKSKIVLSRLRARQALNQDYQDILQDFSKGSIENVSADVLAEILVYSLLTEEQNADSVEKN